MCEKHWHPSRLAGHFLFKYSMCVGGVPVPSFAFTVLHIFWQSPIQRRKITEGIFSFPSDLTFPYNRLRKVGDLAWHLGSPWKKQGIPKQEAFGEPLFVHCPPNSLFSSLCYGSSNAQACQREVTEPGCLKEATPPRKAKRCGDGNSGMTVERTNMSLHCHYSPCSHWDGWPGP